MSRTGTVRPLLLLRSRSKASTFTSPGEPLRLIGASRDITYSSDAGENKNFSSGAMNSFGLMMTLGSPSVPFPGVPQVIEFGPEILEECG